MRWCGLVQLFRQCPSLCGYCQDFVVEWGHPVMPLVMLHCGGWTDDVRDEPQPSTNNKAFCSLALPDTPVPVWWLFKVLVVRWVTWELGVGESGSASTSSVCFFHTCKDPCAQLVHSPSLLALLLPTAYSQYNSCSLEAPGPEVLLSVSTQVKMIEMISGEHDIPWGQQSKAVCHSPLIV